ncbi:MAG TPA: energy transducer TonB [bacterium]|nr:energy transducer TonB [bacterium]
MRTLVGAIAGLVAGGCAVAPPRAPGAPPELLPVVKFAPVYPEEAQARGIEGWVRVRYEVDADGSVVDVAVEESSDPAFEQTSIDAAYQFLFRPIPRGEPAEPRFGTNLFRYELLGPEPRGC